jgi:hypothetical protein
MRAKIRACSQRGNGLFIFRINERIRGENMSMRKPDPCPDLQILTIFHCPLHYNLRKHRKEVIEWRISKKKLYK